MSETPDQTLADRTGLPSDLLYLVEAFPRDRWTTTPTPHRSPLVADARRLS